MNAGDDEFTPPGLIKVSAAALKFARDFRAAAKGAYHGDCVVTFDWAYSVSLGRGPDMPPEDIGACLMLGAYERRHVPNGFTQTVDGLEFAVKIPVAVWQNSSQRLIDFDPSEIFKLKLK